MRYARKFKKTFKKKIAKPYFTRKNQRGYNNRMRLYKEVKALKSIVNAEKKQIVVQPTANSIGQVNGNAEAALVLDITPTPAQGAQDSQRNGDSIKLTTAYFKFQLSQMSATKSPIRGIIEIYQVLGKPQATSEFLNQRWLPNAFITGANIRDFNAQADQDYRQQYRLIAKKNFRLKGDTDSGQTQILNVAMPLKFGTYGHHIKYAENSTTVASGQLIMTVRCDSGNISPSTTSTLGNLVIYSPVSGAYINKSMTFYYYDN